MSLKRDKVSVQFLLRQIHDEFRAEMRPVPSKRKAQEWISGLIDLLFPLTAEDLFSDLQIRKLDLQLRELLQHLEPAIFSIDSIIRSFFDSVPVIFRELQKDAQIILSFDPAAHCIEEVMAAYPGFYAIAAYRFSHELYSMKIPILPRLISENAHSATGIDIHPGAIIGSGFFIDHGTGVVIGETSILGDNIKIYQGVTLGALSVAKSEANKKRHPTIEDNVIIYSGTTILGGNTVIGRDSIIGGNVWLTGSVPPFSLVYHKSEIHVRANKDFDQPVEAIDFTI